MLTLFTVPKPFSGRTSLLQENALATWQSLHADAQVILFGDGDGIAEAAERAGAMNVRTLETTYAGTPRVDDLFARAQQLARFDELCFVNADILLPQTFPSVIGEVRRVLATSVVVGQCRELRVDEPVRRWTAELDARARAAPLRGPGGIDYLAFRRGAFPAMPPFAIGRANFDNWLVWDARRRGLPVVDVTTRLPVVHQSHDYEHVGSRDEAYFGAEARRNYDLAGGRLHLFNIADATHRLTATGVRRNLLAPVRAAPATRWLALTGGDVSRRLRGKRAVTA